MPRSVYGDVDDDEMMFRLPSSSRNSPAPRQLGWSDLGADAYPAISPYEAAALPPPRSLLALPAPPSSSPRLSSTPRMPKLDTDAGGYGSPRVSTPKLSQSDAFPANPKTPYEVLGVRANATQEEIKKAYKKAALCFHPDMCKGDADEVEEATRLFQLIGEAFAVLGDREYFYLELDYADIRDTARRRAEYDNSLRDRLKSRSSSRSKPAQPTSFRSTFVPEPRQAHFDPFSGTAEQEKQDDLRGIDPFYLFTRVFGSAFEFPGATRLSSPAQNHGNSPSAFDTMGDRANHPMFEAASGSRSKPFKVKESHTSAHVNRHGQVNVSKSERSFKMTKNGGMSFESRSFSGSFGSGNMDMLQQFFGAGGMFGQQSGGNIGGASPFASIGGMQSGSSSRRTSFDSSPSMGSGVQRRPSFSGSNSFDGPSSPWSASAGPSQQLAPFGGSRSLSKQDWGNGW